MVKLLSIWIALLVISGCGALPQSSNQSSNVCPNQPPGSLDAKNVKLISLDSSTLKESGQAIAGESIAYAFEAKSGQKLTYQPKNNICVWIYTPDNQLLSSSELSPNVKYADLPLNGKYILQVSAPKGSTTFVLEMSLGTLQASATATSSPISSPTATPTSTPSSSSASTSTAAADLTQEQALEIVKNWFNAKPRVFAPPFDTSLLEKYTTGKYREDRIKPDGSINWLRQNNSYYTYTYFRINRINSFSNLGERPTMQLNISEELYLHGSEGGIDKERSGESTDNYIYIFEKENGVWKIYEYKKI